ncbi:protein kinase [Promicromonospora sp. NPDC090134]|uniref:serine/threonine-protein kinase n=1 Tax=Promicromonospora sp. NPDC090134 TaxID=3364408 RepID=UPI0037FDDEB6
MTDGSLVGGRYELGDLLGVGGTASVFAATDTSAGRPVALKILHPHLSADAASRDAFLAEARAAQELRHPNIAAVHDSGVHEDAGTVLAWIALDLVDGGSVGERVAAGGPLPPAQAAAVLDGVLAALTAAHAAGLVHRDVSPANVLLHRAVPAQALRAEHVRLVDFGLADAAGRTAVGRGVLRAGEDVLRIGPGADGSAVTVVLDAARDRTRGGSASEPNGRTVVAGRAGQAGASGGDLRTAAGGVERTVVGNPQFMSPEQAQGRPVRVAGDLYQAGALLYHLLTGRPPFPRDTDAQVLHAHVSAPPPVPSALVPAARALDRVVTRAMNKTPVRRFRDADEMRAALTEAMGRPDLTNEGATGAGLAGAGSAGLDGSAGGVGSAGAGAAGVDESGVGDGSGSVRVDGAAGADADDVRGGGAGQRRTGDLEYLTPAEPEPVPAARGRGGAAGVGAVLLGLLVTGIAVWAAVAAPGLPQVGSSPSPSASAAPTSAPSASRTASPTASASPSTDPSPSPSETAAAPTASPSPSPEPSGRVTAAAPPSDDGQVAVPVLAGTLAEVQTALREMGLTLGEVTRANSSEVSGWVLDQRPAAGRSVPTGTGVDVTVSSGRNVVPVVTGMTLGAATAELESAGFEAMPDIAGTSPRVPVVGTAPGARTVLRLGVTVTVLVGEPEPEPSVSPSS